MKILKTLALTVAVVAIPMQAFADDKAVVQKFYDFLSNPTSESHAADVKTIAVEDWKSIGDYSGKTKSMDQLVAQISGFGKLVPDLNWEVQEMIQDGDKVIVRGRATGTPNGPMFGVDGKGKSFDIMSIDIHTLDNGKITETYHVEDWSGALRQLSAE